MGITPTCSGRSPHRLEMDTKVENPDFVKEFTADDKGRINLGTDYAGARVKAAVGVLDTNEEDN